MAKQIINKDNNPLLRRHELKVQVVCADVSTIGWCVHKFFHKKTKEAHAIIICHRGIPTSIIRQISEHWKQKSMEIYESQVNTSFKKQFKSK